MATSRLDPVTTRDLLHEVEARLRMVTPQPGQALHPAVVNAARETATALRSLPRDVLEYQVADDPPD